MKKSVIAASVAFCATLGFAEGLTSGVVGYGTQSVVEKTFNALGIAFAATDGAGFKPSEAMSGVGLYSNPADPFSSDQMWIWDPMTGSYEKYYWYDNNDQYTGWWELLSQQKTFEQIHPEGMTPGSSIWFVSSQNSAGGAITFAGAVESADSYTISVTKGNFNLFCNPYPTALNLDDATQADWSAAYCNVSDPFACDQIWIWDPAGSYEKYYWYDNNDQYTGWWELLSQQKMFHEIHPNGLDAGAPIWFVANGTLGDTFDVTFKSPISSK